MCCFFITDIYSNGVNNKGFWNAVLSGIQLNLSYKGLKKTSTDTLHFELFSLGLKLPICGYYAIPIFLISFFTCTLNCEHLSCVVFEITTWGFLRLSSSTFCYGLKLNDTQQTKEHFNSFSLRLLLSFVIVVIVVAILPPS